MDCDNPQKSVDPTNQSQEDLILTINLNITIEELRNQFSKEKEANKTRSNQMPNLGTIPTQDKFEILKNPSKKIKEDLSPPTRQSPKRKDLATMEEQHILIKNKGETSRYNSIAVLQRTKTGKQPPINISKARIHPQSRYGGLGQLNSSCPSILKKGYLIYKVWILLTMYIFAVAVFADICTNMDDLSITTDDGCFLSGSFVVTFKAMNYQINWKRIMKLLNDALKCGDDLCEFSDVECVRDLIAKYQMRNKVIFYGFNALGFILASILLFFTPMEDGLPIRAKCPFNTTMSPWYEISFFVETCAISGSLLGIVAMDSLTIAICSLVTVLFDVLNINFENCTSEDREDMIDEERDRGNDKRHDGKKRNKTFLHRYKTCLQFHQRLVSMIKDYNRIYSSSMFVQMLSSTLIICLTSFQAVVVGGQSSDILKFGIFLSAAVSQLLYICWIGNELHYSCSMLDKSQWLSGWHHERLTNIGQMFMLSTMFVKQSITLKASVFYVLSLETFISHAVGKMRLLVLVLAGCFNVLEIVRCQELSVIRHSDGDIFTLEGSCTEACTVLSSGTASPYTRSPSTAGLVAPNNTCTCQCNHGLPTFREDLRICVNDIHDDRGRYASENCKPHRAYARNCQLRGNVKLHGKNALIRATSRDPVLSVDPLGLGRPSAEHHRIPNFGINIIPFRNPVRLLVRIDHRPIVRGLDLLEDRRPVRLEDRVGGRGNKVTPILRMFPECNVAGFVSSTGQVERVPYVFLPQRGQIIYPHAEIRFEGVTTPVCGITGAQQLGRAGWSELRNLSDTEPPFRLFRDEGRTFLQWIGETGLREAAEGRVVTAKLVCRDASPKSKLPGVFTPCVAFRVAGSPSKSNVREVMFSSTTQLSQGLSTTEYTAIGLSSVILALIYVASVSLYLHSKKAKRKIAEEPELSLTPGREVSGLVKNNPLLAASRHFESDTNSGLTESDVGDDLPPSDGEQGFENVTSAIIHPHCVYMEQSETCFGTGSILGERLPEEDVRVVETADSPHQQDIPVLPGAQRRKLYFNPAYFDRQLLLAPPPAAIEFLLKIREVISIAKHKMAAKKFVPTLLGIPEEEASAEHCDATGKNQQRSTSNSTRSSITKSQRKSQRCTGCPGCMDTFRDKAALSEQDQPSPGESKVRAWLEDVRTTPQRRWQDAEEARKALQESTKTFNKNLEYLKELAKRDFDVDVKGLTGKILSSWKDNPPMLKTFQNMARSEILETDDRPSVSKRSTKSMFEESNCYSLRNRDSLIGANGDEAINAKVRKAIENSFIKQLEENAALEKGIVEKLESKEKKTMVPKDEDNKEERKSDVNNGLSGKQTNMFNGHSARSQKELPDMINELPNAKNTAKRIMDAVIREMVDAKVLEHHSRSGNITDYEVDSLERSKSSRKSSTSPESTDQSSPALSTALPMDEELTMQNAVINTRTGEMMIPNKLSKDIIERSYYSSLPELISSQKSESYSLVSEVYVNDGYDSPACSDDSGPEIQYEPENPGHLTIKVQDSSKNYVKQDESEYEPDTLDRKPMKLKINDDVNYEKEVPGETYVDSLERPAQILLKSKGSFRDQDSPRNNSSLQRGYGSLREIYEARLKSNPRDLSNSTKSLNDHLEDSMSWKKCKYLTPETRQLKRQRQPSNQPDVVPLPPTENTCQHPKPPQRMKDVKLSSNSLSKNGWDRSPAEAGDPTTSNGAPVPSNSNVGNTDCSYSSKPQMQLEGSMTKCRHQLQGQVRSNSAHEKLKSNLPTAWNNSRCQKDRRKSLDRCQGKDCQRKHSEPSLASTCKKHLTKFPRGCESGNSSSQLPGYQQPRAKVEDSGYLSSTDSNGSHKQLLKHEVSSVSETDETESVCDGASESGAESVGTDSVFFGNFRRLTDMSNFSKSIDSGVGIETKNTYVQPFCIRNENGGLERANFSTSDSETESFITVLPLCRPRESI
ncbi:Odorant receptor Or1 [Eufriesea mexicana]|uniref:Odorant receptor Or1 n=1 Tax=Eufriesea mexicana TaxID=516756 RepID=A0A310SAG1_9HYME|nr:Odorant receptor Or1 [Eufriesea mexicana]